MNDDPVPSTEGELIASIGAEIARVGPPADLSDDCAALRSATALVTTDMLVEGVHFDLRHDTAEQVGAQAAVSNLSDLAGSGGAAGWLLWSLALPATWTAERVRALARGFVQTAARHGARLVGGNLARTPGPAVIAVTAGGPLVADRPLTRRGARPGDRIYVTGPLGDAALGVRFPTDAQARAARHGWRPHLVEAAALAGWGRVTAAMDISDGLLLDAARLAAASGVAAHLESGPVPVSALYRARLGEDRALALSGGEDYVLLFTAPADATPPVAATPIGVCAAGEGLHLDGAPATAAGWDHFASASAPGEG